jgi:hypothetical protein
MENNAYISMRLKDLIKVMDARAYVTVFISEKERVTPDGVNVYELLADSAFLERYGGYNVKAIIACGFTSTNILITEERI